MHLPPEAPERWLNVLTGEQLSTATNAAYDRILNLAEILDRFPVALLTPKE